MMSQELFILLGAAATIGFVHTLLGPDHYLPFVALAKARGWTMEKTARVTILCGLGHVAGSIGLGVIGIAVGITLSGLNIIESARGELAAWLLIGFGLVYGGWGLFRGVRNQPHTHVHIHANGTRHVHEHSHRRDHVHVHEQSNRNLTGWTLFVVFVLGPCEPLIPLLMFPAAAESLAAVALVAVVFGAVTIATMTGLVLISILGLRFLPTWNLSRYGHAVAGAVIVLCGIAIQLGY
jgi:sulfite exporter TauE/SafE